MKGKIKMKNLFRRGLALLLIVVILVSAFSISSFAAVSQPQIANTGIRDQVCTSFNNTTAPQYYTGQYTYDNLSTMSASNLKTALNTLMKSTHKNESTYNNCRDYAYYTDCEGGNTTYVTMIYSSYGATKSQWNTGWNREHVWPQSLGGGNTSGGGADLHHIRPSESSINSSRGNKLYGNVNSTSTSKGNMSGTIGGHYDNTYFEPLDNVKGDVARICLYVYVRWGSSWGADSITEVFQSVDVLLEWCALDPVDTWEMERNDVVESVQGNRNVFIDYPELAWQLYGKTAPSDMTTPSGEASDGNQGGNVGGGSGNTPDTPVVPDVPETPEEPVDPQPNPGEDIGGGSNGGSTGDGTPVIFALGANGTASHADGSDATTYSETVGGYTLNITGGTKMYTGARDAKGNSAIKLGASSATGTFSFNVPDDVNSVVISIAQYKANATVVTVNGKQYTITTASNNGAYTDITVDTTTQKTVTVATTSSGKRAMINSITFVPTAKGCEHDMNEHGYCKSCEVGFRTATLVISSDLAIRYGIEVVDEEILKLGALKMVYTFCGTTYEVTDYTMNGEYYVFVFDGIAPDEMTEIITADFYIGEEIVATYAEYSVEANLISVRNKNSSNKTLVQLINDVLIYGAAAQNYTGNNTSDLAGDGLSGVTASTATPDDEMLMEGNNNSALNFKSIGVHFDCTNNIYVKIYVSNVAIFGSLDVDDKSYTLADMTDLGGGYYRLDLDPVQPTMFSEILLLTLVGADGVDYASLIYSVNCYASYMYNGGAAEGSAMYDLALALYRYGVSAAEYSRKNA